MDFFKSVLTPAGTGGNIAAGASKSLVEDWNSYANQPDVEAGPGTSASDALLQKAQTAGTFLTESIANVQKTVSSTVSGLPSAETFSIPTGQQLMYFFAFLAGGGVFLLMAFMVFLPVIIISPSKFAMSFTLGCLLVLAGFAQLRGWKQQMSHMLSRERLPFSSAYAGSILATLYAALIMKSYLLSLLCSGLQMVALMYYLMSYFPGGTQGVKFMLGLFYNALAGCFGQAQRALS